MSGSQTPICCGCQSLPIACHFDASPSLVALLICGESVASFYVAYIAASGIVRFLACFAVYL